ncbi:MAG: helix-turn-helix transcriptional regulator [Candidatus Methanomethylophilaceae archaeon]|nr:helix-turn-helix transcriptional regulator [Candidatus Methanomethylophilaceae archaeon]MBR4225567.1 helix-turn-helix transcriptional regulator [Candidatus Methanomethylophilaceae archaeon]
MDKSDFVRMRSTLRGRLRQRIKELRSESVDSLTLPEMARGIGISTRYFSDILNKDTNISFDVIIRLIDYFDVSFEWLVGMEDDDRMTGPSISEVYGISEDSLDRLAELASGEMGYSQAVPDFFDPPQLGYEETGSRFRWETPRYYGPDDDTVDKRRRRQAESILDSINTIICDEELPVLLDAYLHSVWALQVRYRNLSEEISPCELDLVLGRQILDRLDEIRMERESRCRREER